MSLLSILRILPFVVLCACKTATGGEHADERPPVSWGRNPLYGLDPVHPHTYTSPSGEYSLNMVPERCCGQFSAVYRLTMKGQMLWSGERPYTLRDRELVVTDRGFVVGFAYSVLGTKPPSPTDEDFCLRSQRPDYFCVLIIDRAGKELLEDTMIRCLPGAWKNVNPPQEPRPYAKQLIVDPENDRVVVHVADWANGCQRDECGDDFVPSDSTDVWRVYRLSTGNLIGRYSQADILCWPRDARPLDTAWVVEAQPVRGTPLLLLHACLSKHKPRSLSARFLLVNNAGKPTWRLDAPADYDTVREAESDPFLRSYFACHPGIVRVQDAGRFDLRLVKDRKRLTFSVKERKGGEWVVSEIRRTDDIEADD